MSSADLASATPQQHILTREERKVIFASSLGTVFEWYDFFLYGALAAIISKQFFAGVNETTGFILALLTFSAGFLVRPFGALVFGRLGDRVGRKYTFLATIILMGLSTFSVGLLPAYDRIGIAAPVILVLLRMLQGLAIGGEYGGAAIYVCEHAPDHKRGHFTSWIQSTATLGLILSLLVIHADPATCHFQFDPVGKAALNSPCDKVVSVLVKSGTPYSTITLPAGSGTLTRVGEREVPGADKAALLAALKEAGYSDSADSSRMNMPMIVVLLAVVCLIGCMSYGPLAALMVELFPTPIRYTSLSLPYHIGNGWIGGMLPSTAFALVAYTGNVFYGLWYPVLVCLLSFVVCALFMRETFRNDIHRH